MCLDEVRIKQVFVGLDPQHPRLVFDREGRGVDGREFRQQDVVLEELGPLVGQTDEFIDVLVEKLLDLVLVAKRIVQLLNELLRVVVHRVAAKHREAVFPVFEAHLVKEFGKDHAERTESVATVGSKQFGFRFKDLLVHVEDHALVLPVLLEPLLVLLLEEAVLHDGNLVRVPFKLEEKVHAEGPQVARHIHDQFVEDPGVAPRRLILLLQLLNQLEETSQVNSKQTPAVFDFKEELLGEVGKVNFAGTIKDLGIEHLVKVSDYGPTLTLNFAPCLLSDGFFGKLARLSGLEKVWHRLVRCLVKVRSQSEVDDLRHWCLLKIFLHQRLAAGVVQAGDCVQNRLVGLDKLIKREDILGEGCLALIRLAH